MYIIAGISVATNSMVFLGLNKAQLMWYGDPNYGFKFKEVYEAEDYAGTFVYAGGTLDLDIQPSSLQIIHEVVRYEHEKYLN